MTKRQRQVARIILSQGADNATIAKQLGLSEDSIKAHVHRMLNVTGMDNRMAMALKILHDPKLLAEVFELRPRRQADWLKDEAA